MFTPFYNGTSVKFSIVATWIAILLSIIISKFYNNKTEWSSIYCLLISSYLIYTFGNLSCFIYAVTNFELTALIWVDTKCSWDSLGDPIKLD